MAAIARINDIKEDIYLVQPNNLTFAKYEFTAWQENVLTLIIDRVQKDITGEEPIETDLFNEPLVTLDCADIGGRNNKTQILAELEKFRQRSITFSYLDPKIHRTIRTTGGIFYRIHDIPNTNQVQINIDKWAVPFLLYYGKKTQEGKFFLNFTRFNKQISLDLVKSYSKRIYKFVCSSKERGYLEISIDLFKERLCLPVSYDNKNIKQRVLLPAKEELDKNSDITFDFKFCCRTKNSKTKPKADTIFFYIYDRDKQEIEKIGERNSDIYKYVKDVIINCLNEKNKTADLNKIMYKICKIRQLEHVHNKCIYYNGELKKGNLSKKMAVNIILKILRDDCFIDI